MPDRHAELQTMLRTLKLPAMAATFADLARIMQEGVAEGGEVAPEGLAGVAGGQRQAHAGEEFAHAAANFE